MNSDGDTLAAIMMQKTRKDWKDRLYLTAITLLCYWPVSFFVFSLKNDSAAQYLPFRYSLSEAVRSGHFPFWSPYLYTGFPVHADMQGMTWNPIVLLLSLFTRYDMSVLQLEVTIYLLIAAWGMYALLKAFGIDRRVCIAGAVCYAGCGFINGSASVIPWVSSASFIPFVFLYLKRFAESPLLRHAVWLGVYLALLFLCGYPSLFIYTIYVCAAIYLYYLFGRSHRAPLLKTRSWLYLALCALIFVALCAPAIISYWEFLPYYSRGSGVSLERAQQNPFPLFSSISFVLPGAVMKDHAWLYSDVNMRNTYVGLLPFLLFLLSVFGKKDRAWYLLAGITLFSYLFSLGDLTPVRKLTYYTLPLFDTFRHPGNFRLYSSMGIILLAARFVQQLPGMDRESLRRRALVAGYAIAAACFFAGIILLATTGVRQNLTYLSGHLHDTPKRLLDATGFNTMLCSQLFLQGIFAAWLVLLLRKGRLGLRNGMWMTVINAVVFCWISLPFTFISQVRTKPFDAFVHSFPKGYPAPDPAKSVRTNEYADSLQFPVYGYTNFYEKDISFQDQQVTPTLNTDYLSFSGARGLRKALRHNGWVYLADTVLRELPSVNDPVPADGRRPVYWNGGTGKIVSGNELSAGTIAVKEFGPNRFVLDVQTGGPAFLNIFQQYHHSWHASVNGKPVTLLKTNIAFMGILLPGGKQEVVMEYRPDRVIAGGYLSLATVLLLLAAGAIVYTKRNSPRSA